MKKNKKKGEKYSSRLTLKEIQQYEAIGEIDYGQDFLEMFSDRMINDLIKIKDSRVSDNQAKADAVEKYLGSYGFVELDLGTNIYVMAHYKYPGVVFKIALDDCGVADNFNDEWLQDYIPNLVRVVALHPSGMVSVQERKVIFKTKNRINMFMGEILSMLDKLSEQFVLVDVSPKSMRNFYLDRDGTIGLADASDVYLIPENYDIFKCRNIIDTKANGKSVRCGGKLVYDDIYYELVCKKCGCSYNPWSLKRSKKEELKMNLVSPGLTKNEWEAANEYGRLARRISRTLPKGLSVGEQMRLIEQKIAEMKEAEESDVHVEGRGRTQGTVVIHGDDEAEAPVMSNPNPKPEEPKEPPVADDDSEEPEDSFMMLERAPMNEIPESANISEQVANAISERLSDGDCRVEVRMDEDGSPAIYITANSPDLINTLNEVGPSVYLSNNGGREFTQVVSPGVFSNLLDYRLKEMEQEGTWFPDD